MNKSVKIKIKKQELQDYLIITGRRELYNFPIFYELELFFENNRIKYFNLYEKRHLIFIILLYLFYPFLFIIGLIMYGIKGLKDLEKEDVSFNKLRFKRKDTLCTYKLKEVEEFFIFKT